MTASQHSNENNQCLVMIQKLKKKYRAVFVVGKELKPMKGRPAILELKDNVKIKPTHIYTPRKTVYALQGSAELERLGATRRVKEPTDWVSPCQFVPKKNGGARLVTDLVGLNKFLKGTPFHARKGPAGTDNGYCQSLCCF